ncbi:hypothetical protein AVEN_74947-1 [Araneus ventricosus]|uniref:Uncharacterized protein n=1 Tax=Araneus ventricosus TaxID=182803 RepID=A0A4Y2J0W2_ARAVE|nr:hypothetical protein AVEN_74947-1 [Araneus ventricosus]
MSEQRVEDDWMEDEDEANNEKNRKKNLRRQEGSFPLRIFCVCEGRENTGVQVFLLRNIIYIAKASVHCIFNIKCEINLPTQDQRVKNGNSRRVPKGHRL